MTSVLTRAMAPRGNLATRRMTAHWVVLAAAALTTLVAAAVAVALAVFAGQGLPLAARHDLSVAPNTAVAATGADSGDPQTIGQQVQKIGQQLQADIASALGGVPSTFNSAVWADPLNLAKGAVPAAPATTPKGDQTVVEAASIPGITSHAVLVSGAWPAGVGQAGSATAASAPAAGTSAAPIPAALPATTAAQLHVTTGDVVTFIDGVSNKKYWFRITGLFAPRPATGNAGSFWQLSTIPASGSITAEGDTTYGPLLISQDELLGQGAPLTVSTGSWVAQPDMSKFTGVSLPAAAANVSALFQSQFAGTGPLSSLQLNTGLATALSDAASNLAVSRSLLVIMALQLLVLAVAALLAVARMLARQREGETALLNARGATRWQLLRLTAAEVVPLCAVTAVAGGALGLWLAEALATAGSLRAAGTSLPGLADTWTDATAAGAAVAVVAIVTLLAPVLSAGPAMTEARARRSRAAMVAGATRAGADLALVVLAVLACWQLRRYSAGSGDGTVSPVLALAPALALAGGTAVTLRLLPLAARTGELLAARGRRLTAPLASWQFSRQPLSQGGPALLLVMAVATGTLALAQHASWVRSAADQSAFSVGADVQVDTPAPLAAGQVGAVANAAGVTSATAVYTQYEETPTQIIAVNAAQAAGIVKFRSDQLSVPASSLFSKIAPKSQPGTAITGRPAAVTFTATLGSPDTPLQSGSSVAVQSASVTVTVADATGDMYQLDAGTLQADGQGHVLTAPLGGDHVSYPLRLVQVSLGYQMPLAKSEQLSLTVTGPAFSGWRDSASSPQLQEMQAQQVLADGAAPVPGLPSAKGDTATFPFASGDAKLNLSAVSFEGITQPSLTAQLNLSPPGAASGSVPLPTIATSAFLRSGAKYSVGSVVPATINGTAVSLSIVGVVKSFPTVTNGTGALIIDLPTIQQRIIGQGALPLNVTEWWLATAGHQVPPGLAGELPLGSTVTGTGQATAALTGDPLSGVPQQALLALAIAAALLGITGFWVSIAANVRQRRAETALLAALGVSQRGAAAQLCLEKLMLSVPSALFGLVLGTLVSWLLVPAVTLTAAAAQPVPPAVTLLDLTQTVPLAAAVAVLPALAAALVMIRRPDPAAELRTAEAG